MTALGEAVRAGGTEAVRALLEGGADPDAPDGDGLPPLCAAVAAYAYKAAEALVAAGADPDRVLPDGTTPLLWSQDLPDPGERLPEAERLRLLDAARRWCAPLRGAVPYPPFARSPGLRPGPVAGCGAVPGGRPLDPRSSNAGGAGFGRCGLDGAERHFSLAGV